MPHNMPNSSSASDHLSYQSRSLVRNDGINRLFRLPQTCVVEGGERCKPLPMQKQKDQGRYRLGASDLPACHHRDSFLLPIQGREENKNTDSRQHPQPINPFTNQTHTQEGLVPGVVKRNRERREIQREILSRNANGRTKTRLFSKGETRSDSQTGKCNANGLSMEKKKRKWDISWRHSKS